jgi:hypothetical protein
MLKDFIIFQAACCSPPQDLSLHIRLMPQQDYDRMKPRSLCDKARKILAQPKNTTFKAAQDLYEEITAKLREKIYPC